MDEYNKHLGIIIKNLRKDHKLSQDEFCTLLGNKITRSNLSKIELGKISTSSDLIREIILKFNISPYKLLNINNDNDYLVKYDQLNNKDKQTINLMIDHLHSNSNGNLYTSMNTNSKEENKKSS